MEALATNGDATAYTDDRDSFDPVTGRVTLRFANGKERKGVRWQSLLARGVWTDIVSKARDGDGDGFVYDGTPRMRPVGPGDLPIPKGFRLASDDDRKRLKLPPAWTAVVVSEDPKGVNGCLARGRDKKGRLQSRYSAQHTEAQAAAKYQRVKRILPKLPKLDRRISKDRFTSDDAGALLLMRQLGMRPGSDLDTKADTQAYGATTLQRRHVKVSDGTVHFDFIGKKGVRIQISTKDKRVLDVVEDRLSKTKRRTDDLFPDTDSIKVRSYMKGIVGEDFKVKDLRTVRANEIALQIIDEFEAPTTKAQFKKARLFVGEQVAAQLGNTRTESLKSYINPTVFAKWEAGLSG